MSFKQIIWIACAVFVTSCAAPATTPATSPIARATISASCAATPEDQLGPFYKPNAPPRAKVDKGGYVLSGVVRSAANCSPIVSALVEFWLAAPNGEYDDDHRAVMLSEKDGAYRFESNLAVPYAGRPPHIHVRVTANGFKELVTQHYPKAGQIAATFDLVITPK